MLPGGSQNRQNVAKIAPDSAFLQGGFNSDSQHQRL
ncbi:hypothetical protein XOCgx_1372 [Xanthomonas oryzae pv. oryzicola]|nr:hypothetical protein XOCgx_1372 [Xanthomonas oryzae pv. oryzicola]